MYYIIHIYHTCYRICIIYIYYVHLSSNIYTYILIRVLRTMTVFFLECNVKAFFSYSICKRHIRLYRTGKNQRDFLKSKSCQSNFFLFFSFFLPSFLSIAKPGRWCNHDHLFKISSGSTYYSIHHVFLSIL
jgi:hypothetical protein